MYSISKDFGFSASHQLHGLPDEHPCSRLHGHNYKVRITIKAPETDDIGFVYDYRNLDSIKKWLDESFDHRHLNDILPTMNPTAEILAEMIYYWIRQGSKIWSDLTLAHEGNFRVIVGVSETDKTWAYYDEDEK